MSGSGVPTWEDVARDHGRFLYTVAYRLTGNHDDAQDLVQEVLLRVRRGLETYRPGSMEGWLSRIVTNVFLDEHPDIEHVGQGEGAGEQRPREGQPQENGEGNRDGSDGVCPGRGHAQRLDAAV